MAQVTPFIEVALFYFPLCLVGLPLLIWGNPMRNHVMPAHNGAMHMQHDANIDERLRRLERQVDEGFARIGEQFGRRFDGVDERLDDMSRRMEYCNDLAHSRAYNSGANMDEGPLRSLPLPTGGYPPPEIFPRDANQLRKLDPIAVRGLLELYELPIYDNDLTNQVSIAA
ncbi:unnamed protein product [Rhizoctonia solani]|uniref:Uncharacterized protein n=1 Tax=Rhizoctonia solani TaxID=456999 RepID=A0A8H2XAL3_9AGAM|nr:unnamed protein product [Rhizoctonia solani]